MKKENALAEALKPVQHAWRHRRGINVLGRQLDEIRIKKLRFYLEHDIPGTVLDVIDVLWPEPKPKPQLTHKKKTPGGWHLIFTLPPGVSYKEVANRQDYFSDACRALVKIENKGGYLNMNICSGKMDSYYPFIWDPVPYLKTMDLPFPVGHVAAGLEVQDLAAIPHLRVAGTTFTGPQYL